MQWPRFYNKVLQLHGACFFVQSVALLSTVMYGESMQKQWRISVFPPLRSSE